MAALTDDAAGTQAGADAPAAVLRILEWNQTQVSTCEHKPPDEFVAGEAVPVSITATGKLAARLHYRHVNQAERWQVTDMQCHPQILVAEIPASYTQSPYPLQYYFELERDGEVTLCPGFAEDFSNEPYHTVRQVRG